jgi:hypothetical protein
MKNKLTWQMSTPVSLSRAGLVASMAENYRAILDDLGEDSSREGLRESVSLKKLPVQYILSFIFFKYIQARVADMEKKNRSKI